MTTFALFKDQEINTGSEFKVGTLELEVNGSNNSEITAFNIQDIGSGEELGGEQLWTLKNKGTLPGKLVVSLINVADKENGCNAPESKVDQTCSSPGIGEGELGKIIIINTYINGKIKSSTKLTEADIKNMKLIWETESPTIISAGSSVEVKMSWLVEGDHYGNEIQSDSVNFDVQFDLEQISISKPNQ
ncbi:MAG: hypothetical protein O2871_01700 [bacterium]|nr:hypothetical protein [bacterium]